MGKMVVAHFEQVVVLSFDKLDDNVGYEDLED